MVGAIEELNQFTRSTEAQRKDNLADTLKTMLEQFDRDMKQTLGSLRDGFSQALVGDASRSFDRVLKSLEATGQVVERMNSQFEQNQSAIKALVEQARDSASRQIELGQAQVEDLASVLRGLMSQLKETTGSSVSEMNSSLTRAVERMTNAGLESNERIRSLVADLATQIEARNGITLSQLENSLDLITDRLVGKIGKFSDEIAEAAGRNTEATGESIRKLLGEVGELHRQNAERAAALLERYQGQLDRTDLMAKFRSQRKAAHSLEGPGREAQVGIGP
jgi:uncharacterized protein YoxC